MSSRWTAQDLADYEARRGVKVAIPKAGKQNKFFAKKTEADGIIFDSKREAARYRELSLMQQAGAISNLTLQTDYPLVVNGVKIASYRSDFEYIQDGEKVVEDSKSDYTKKLLWYRMKKKLMLAIHGIEIKET